MSLAQKESLFSAKNPYFRWILLANIVLTTLLAIFSAVATIIAEDAIQGELGLSDPLASWITTLYLLGVNTMVPVAGWFSERYGKEKIYAIGILIFTLGSGLAGLSQNFWMIASARWIQGVGGGLIFPTGLALIASHFPKSRLNLALSLYIGGSFGGGLGLGLPFAGFVTQFYSWRDVFLLIVPFSMCTCVCCWLAHEKEERKKVPFDLWGFLSFVTFITSLLIALVYGPLPSTAAGWREPWILALFLLAFVSLLCTLYIEKNHPNPIIPLSLFKDPIFSISTLAMFLLGMSFFASVSVTVNYMLKGLFYERYVIGKIAMIYGVTMALCSLIATQLMKKIPAPFLNLTGLALLITSYFLSNDLSWLTGPTQISWILALRGVALGFCLGPVTTQALRHVPAAFSSQAAMLLTFFRQVGGTYGGTIISILTIKRKIFHAARFSEQTNSQIPGYKVTFQKLSSQFYSDVSDKGLLSALQAKRAIIANIETQAYIQALNDAMIVFGYIALSIALTLLVLNLLRLKRFFDQKRSSIPSS